LAVNVLIVHQMQKKSDFNNMISLCRYCYSCVVDFTFLTELETY